MMEQVVLKPENLPEQLRILASDLRKEHPVQEQLKAALKQDFLVGKILDAVRQGTSM
jgi:3-methyladenine DNA glycosylase AlkC